MPRKLETEIKVGLFVTIGVGLLMVAVLALGNTENIFARTHKYTTHLAAVDGLITGAKVVLGGLTVGSVAKIDLDPTTRNIAVTLSVDSKYGQWIRKGAEVEIATQGVLGDKYISITMAAEDQPLLESGQEIPARPGKDIAQFLSKGDQLMLSLNSIAGSLDRVIKEFDKGNRAETLFGGMATSAKNLAAATEKLNTELSGNHIKGTLKSLHSILSKVDSGTGTLGALINDPGLYDDAKSLMGGANRNRLLRNLVRQTIKDGDEKRAPSP